MVEQDLEELLARDHACTPAEFVRIVTQHRGEGELGEKFQNAIEALTDVGEGSSAIYDYHHPLPFGSPPTRATRPVPGNLAFSAVRCVLCDDRGFTRRRALGGRRRRLCGGRGVRQSKKVDRAHSQREGFLETNGHLGGARAGSS